jgi:hypothetical protein
VTGESVPPVATTSVESKSVADSESVKLMVEVALELSVARLEVINTVGATVSTMIGEERAVERLALPAVSVKAPAATEIVAGPVEAVAGVKIAVNAVPEPVIAESVPPVAVMPEPEYVAASESANVTVAIWPARNVVGVELTVTVGATVSIVIGGDNELATLRLPATSVKAPAATEIVPAAVEPAAGANVAVNLVPEPVMAESEPPTAVIPEPL